MQFGKSAATRWRERRGRPTDRTLRPESAATRGWTRCASGLAVGSLLVSVVPKLLAHYQNPVSRWIAFFSSTPSMTCGLQPCSTQFRNATLRPMIAPSHCPDKETQPSRRENLNTDSHQTKHDGHPSARSAQNTFLSERTRQPAENKGEALRKRQLFSDEPSNLFKTKKGHLRRLRTAPPHTPMRYRSGYAFRWVM
jgi:hypothetical protein